MNHLSTSAGLCPEGTTMRWSVSLHFIVACQWCTPPSLSWHVNISLGYKSGPSPPWLVYQSSVLYRNVLLGIWLYVLYYQIKPGQAYKDFYTLGRCKIKCLNNRFNNYDGLNPINMLGCCVLTLRHMKFDVSALFSCFRMRL